MSRHWKALLWFLLVAAAFGAIAHATHSYVLMIAVVYVALISWFVLAASFMDEGRPARRPR